MSKRTALKKAKMPRWIWQLRRKGFHVQLKKYLSFLWRQRPNGCNWSRELRGRYFNRTYHTIAKWDAYLIKKHLVWVSGKGSMEHRIGARPYYSKSLWQHKYRHRNGPPTSVTIYTPYTAQHKTPLRKGAYPAKDVSAPPQLPDSKVAGAAPARLKPPGAQPPKTLGGSGKRGKISPQSD